MESTFSPLGFMIFGISISFYVFIVQSHMPHTNNDDESKSPSFMMSSPPPPPPPRSSSSPPPSSPPFQSQPHISPSLSPSPSPSLSPSPSSSPSPSPHPQHHHIYLPSPPPPYKMNAGKKVGLLFVGIAVIMQVGMVGFLVIKRRQLLKSDDRYENCS